jgi:type IV secretion system protein VirB3
MGGERRPILLLLIVTSGLTVSSLNLVSFIVAGILYFGGLFYLRQLAKADPFMIGIYQKSIKYRAYYPPRSRPSCIN